MGTKLLGTWAIAAVAAWGLLACGGAEPVQGGTESDPLYTVTRVTLRDNLPATVLVSTIRRSQQLAGRTSSRDVRPTQTVEQDGNCYATNLWVYDETGETGNEICFYNNSTSAASASLHNFCRIYQFGSCIFDWASAVRSYWPGDDGGYFRESSVEFGYEYFSAGGSKTNAGTYAQNANIIGLNGYTP